MSQAFVIMHNDFPHAVVTGVDKQAAKAKAAEMKKANYEQSRGAFSSLVAFFLLFRFFVAFVFLFAG